MHPQRVLRLLTWIALWLPLACSSGPTATPAPRAQPELAGQLVELGERALERGDAEQARARFERAVAADPGSVAARTALVRALVAEGETERAHEMLLPLLEREPPDAGALLEMARIDEARGDPAAARTWLERGLEHDPGRLELHAALARLTGPAPRGLGSDPVGLADAHPYDPRALVAAGEALLAQGQPGRARDLLESAVALADLGPGAARRATALLAASQPDWADRGIVPVHVYADEGLHRHPAWRFRFRALWIWLSQQLAPVLDARFVPLSIQPFESAGAGASLDGIQARFLAGQPRIPSNGIVAIFTARPTPKLPGRWRMGQAEFLGRVMAVRLEPGALSSRVLAHEVAHLYGGVHVSPELPSLMNPSGDAGGLDQWNRRILASLRGRSFGLRGLDAEVLAHADLRELIEAYRAAVRANAAFRRRGMQRAVASLNESRYLAASEAREAMQLDDHLGDVSNLLGHLMLRDGRPAAAALWWEAAARFYGPRSPRGREVAERARTMGRLQVGE